MPVLVKIPPGIPCSRRASSEVVMARSGTLPPPKGTVKLSQPENSVCGAPLQLGGTSKVNSAEAWEAVARVVDTMRRLMADLVIFMTVGG